MKKSLMPLALMILSACATTPGLEKIAPTETLEAPLLVDSIELLPCVWVLYQPSLEFRLGCR